MLKKILKWLASGLLVQQRLQCLHNADCLLGGLASSEKHVARPPLMDD